MAIEKIGRRPHRGLCVWSFVLAALFALCVAGCGKSSDGTDISQDTFDSQTIATVNGVVITRGQMYTAMEQFVPAQLQNFPQNPLLQDTAGKIALQHLISDELMLELAKANQVPVTDDEVQSRYDDIKMVKESQSTSTFEDLLTDQGLTVEEYKDQKVKGDVAQFNIVTKGITVSNDEMRSYYHDHIADYTEPARLHLERIVLPDEATAQKAFQLASQSESLDGVIGENVAAPLTGGNSAADIAQWIPNDSSMSALKPVFAVALTAHPNSVLPPVNVQNQWWLVKLDAKKPKEILPFDAVKHIVAWNILTSKANAAGNFQKLSAAMADITQQSVITVVSPQYIPLVKQMKNAPIEGQQRSPSASPAN